MPGADSSRPLLGEILAWTTGERVLLRRQFSPETDPFLADHALGRRLSVADPTLHGLSVMPLTVSMEMAAEAAALLMPGQVLVQMQDVKALRWILFEDRPVPLQVEARRAGAYQVQTRIWQGDDESETVLEALMLFGAERPPGPAAEGLDLTAARPCDWNRQEIYDRVMFHGPLFQGVQSVEALGENGVKATLLRRGTGSRLTEETEPGFVTDPVLLDQPGQVVGIWTAQMLESGYVIFPYALESLRIYQEPPAEFLECRAAIRLLGEQQTSADMQLVDGQGRVVVDFRRWQDRRFDLPRPFYHLIHEPAQILLSRPYPGFPGIDDCLIRRIGVQDFREGFLTAHGGIWLKVLAYLILSRRERVLWHELRVPLARRVEWLLGRLAAKEAARLFLSRRFGLELPPADLEILPDGAGRPCLGGAWQARVPWIPLLSLAHSRGEALAAVAGADTYRGVGVDLEAVDALDAGMASLAFSPRERHRLADTTVQAAALRFWCAKEAAGKSSGQGLYGNPAALEVVDADPAGERVQVQVPDSGAWDGRPIPVQVAHEDDWVVALALVPRGNGD